MIDVEGKSHIYPDLSHREFECKLDYINKSLGLSLAANEAASLLKKMSLHAQPTNNNGTIKVSVPCTRSGINFISSLNIGGKKKIKQIL